MSNNKESLLSTKPTQAPNKILRGHVPQSSSADLDRRLAGKIGCQQERGGTKDGRALPRKLLDDGQGKLGTTTLDMEISTNSDGSVRPQADMSMSPLGQETGHHKLLLPPVIEATGEWATGATTDALQKQNKHQRTADLLTQHLESQWTIHQGHTLL